MSEEKPNPMEVLKLCREQLRNMEQCAFDNMEGANAEAFEAYGNFFVACQDRGVMLDYVIERLEKQAT